MHERKFAALIQSLDQVLVEFLEKYTDGRM